MSDKNKKEDQGDGVDLDAPVIIRPEVGEVVVTSFAFVK